MPLRNPRIGAVRDIKLIINKYDWRTKIRYNNAPILPTVAEWTELGDRRGIQDPGIVIQAFVMRGIETSLGTVALRARMGITLHCYSKTPAICTMLADGVWNAFYATDDIDGNRNYVSTSMTTLRKVIPTGYRDTPAQKEYDGRGQPTGWWVQIVRLEAETQQAN